VPPSINISSTISIDENASNATSNFTTLSVSDADGHSLTLTLGSQSPGNDASDFTLVSNGELSFNASPDYESPADYDTNNIYDLKLTATDGIETVSQDFSVVVLNVSD
jgi:serralysin